MIYKRTLTREQGLRFLGVFHIICLVSIMLSTTLIVPFSRTSITRHLLVPIIVNALVAFGVTAPLAGRKPDVKMWRSFWILWIAVGYCMASILLDRWFTPNYGVGLSTDCTLNCYLPHRLGIWHIPIAVICTLVIALLVRGLRWDRIRYICWYSWIALALLIIASNWNALFQLIPSYTLVFMGCYVAFSSLGHKWCWRAVNTVAVAVLLPCAFMICNFWFRYTHAIAAPGQPLMSLAWVRTNYTHIPWNSPDSDARWLTIFPGFILGLLSGHKSRWLKTIFILITLVLLFCIYFGGRRSAYFSVLALAPASLMLIDSAKIRKVVVVLALVMAMTATLMTINPKTREVSKGHLSAVLYGSYDGHAFGYISSADMFMQQPLVGVGVGRYFAEYQQWAWQHFPDGNEDLWGHMDSPTPFNDYLYVLVSGGVSLFVLSFGAVVQIWLHIWPLINSKKLMHIRFVLLGIVIQVLALAPTMAVGTSVFSFGQWLILNAMFIATTLGAAHGNAKDIVK